MDIITWIIFGLIVGVIANAIEPGRTSGGLVGTTILGILGALVGGFLGNLLFGQQITGFNFPSLVIAVIGAIVLVWALRAVRRA